MSNGKRKNAVAFTLGVILLVLIIQAYPGFAVQDKETLEAAGLFGRFPWAEELIEKVVMESRSLTEDGVTLTVHVAVSDIVREWSFTA